MQSAKHLSFIGIFYLKEAVLDVLFESPNLTHILIYRKEKSGE